MNVFLPVKQLQTFLICFILMTISVSTRAADSPLLIKNLEKVIALYVSILPRTTCFCP